MEVFWGGDGRLVFSPKHPHSFTQMFPQCIEMRGAQSGPAHEFKCQVHLSGQLALHICAALSLVDADLYVEVQTASCPSSLCFCFCASFTSFIFLNLPSNLQLRWKPCIEGRVYFCRPV